MTQPPAGTATAPPRPQVKGPIRFRARTALLILAACLAVVVAAVALVVALSINKSAYNAGHQPTPTAAVRGFLFAMLDDRNPASTDKYLCDGKVRTQVHRLIAQIHDFSSSGHDSITYSWGVNKPRQTGDTATVTADVTARTTTDGATITQPTQTWTMSMRNAGGWKVCQLRIPS